MASKLPAARQGKASIYRSRGEEAIADTLDRAGVAYLYEYPLAVVDRGLVRLWYPDFQLRDLGMLIEYCGRPEHPECASRMAHKESVYRSQGIACLTVTPDWFDRDWPRNMLNGIESILSDRLDHYRETVIADRRT